MSSSEQRRRLPPEVVLSSDTPERSPTRMSRATGCFRPGLSIRERRPRTAARREAREEASVQLELVRVAGVFGGDPHFRMTYANGDEVAWVTTLLEASMSVQATTDLEWAA
jgi:8-oxo-dGTP pyrophosphatase MutT (NUDIX family)